MFKLQDSRIRFGQIYRVHNGSKLERISWVEVKQQKSIRSLTALSVLIK
jgi:hypothetical protein